MILTSFRSVIDGKLSFLFLQVNDALHYFWAICIKLFYYFMSTLLYTQHIAQIPLYWKGSF